MNGPSRVRATNRGLNRQGLDPSRIVSFLLLKSLTQGIRQNHKAHQPEALSYTNSYRRLTVPIRAIAAAGLAFLHAIVCMRLFTRGLDYFERNR